MCRDSSARNAVVVETDGLTGSGPDRGGYLVIRLGRWLGSEVERFSVGGGAQPLPSGGEFGSGQQRHRRFPRVAGPAAGSHHCRSSAPVALRASPSTTDNFPAQVQGSELVASEGAQR